MMIGTTVLLIVHLLLAVTLLGAVTHQVYAVWRPVPAGQASFLGSFHAVRTQLYVTPIVILFICVIALGGIMYPTFRNHVSPALVTLNLQHFQGFFDMKEHLAALGFGTLAVYWYLWKAVPLNEQTRTRQMVTSIIAFIVWYNFIVGHLLNNIKGFGS